MGHDHRPIDDNPLFWYGKCLHSLGFRKENMILENDFRHKTKGCVHAPLVERVRSAGRWTRISITNTKVRAALLNENQ